MLKKRKLLIVLIILTCLISSNIQYTFSQGLNGNSKGGWDYIQNNAASSLNNIKTVTGSKYKEGDIDKGYLKIGATFNYFPSDLIFSFESSTGSGDKVDVRTVLNELAKRGGMNIVIDESVSGDIDCHLSNITLNEAMELVLAASELEAKVVGNTILVASKPAMIRKGLNRRAVKSFRLNHANALDVASILEASIFNKEVKLEASKEEATGGEAGKGASGTAFQAMGIDPNTGIVQPSNAPSQIQSQPSTPSVGDGSQGGDSSSASSGTVKNANSKMVRVIDPVMDPAEGVNNASTLAGNISIQNYKNTSNKYEVANNSGGPIVIPDTRTNSILIAGVEDDLYLAEQTIKALDKAQKQVFIEVSLIEVRKSDTATWGSQVAAAGGRFATGFNNNNMQSNMRTANSIVTDTSGNVTGLYSLLNSQQLGIGELTDANQFGIDISTVQHFSKEIMAKIVSMMEKNRIKLIANPNVMTLDGNEALIKLTDQIVNKIIITTTQSNVTESQELADVGMVLNVLPRISNDGYISMRIRPSLTIKGDTYVSKVSGSTINFVKTREVIIQDVRVKSGETLALAGLITETTNAKEYRIPGLSDIPIVGNFFRTVNTNKEKTELIILLTPRIVDDIGLQQSPIEISKPQIN